MKSVHDRELFYRENQEYIDGQYIYLPLTIDFLRENRNKMDWVYVLEHQKLSEKFLEEIERYINYQYMTEEAINNIPREFIERYSNHFPNYCTAWINRWL